MKIALILLIVAFVIGGVLLPGVVNDNSKTLACDQVSTTIAATALRRDEGVLRESSLLRRDSSLKKVYSSKQIEAMLDAVYVHGIGKSPDELRALAHARCMQEKGR